jgi:hypothetical protein
VRQVLNLLSHISSLQAFILERGKAAAVSKASANRIQVKTQRSSFPRSLVDFSVAGRKPSESFHCAATCCIFASSV